MDWKTGGETEASRNKAFFQLCVYASWTARTMGVPLHAVRVHPRVPRKFPARVETYRDPP